MERLGWEEKSYINDRNPGKADFFGDARKKAGKTAFLSKLHFFSEISFNY